MNFSPMSTQSTFENFKSENHEFKPRDSSDSRSPCPALNALANHGYIPRNGKDFTFIQLIKAVVLVYNISYPLALLLASVGFLTCGKLSFHSYNGPLSNPRTRSSQDNEVTDSWIVARFINRARSLMTCRPSWTLDLQSLSQRGSLKIAHDGSFVHCDGKPSTSPDPNRVKDLLQRASTACDAKGDLKGGLDFTDIVRIRTENVLSAAHPMLSEYHEQISLGECSLLWELFQSRTNTMEGVVPTYRLQQWLGEERLPDGWWESRPKKVVGLLQAKKTANEIARLSKQIAEEAGIRKLTIHDAISMD